MMVDASLARTLIDLSGVGSAYKRAGYF
jgi:hypothetical protein